MSSLEKSSRTVALIPARGGSKRLPRKNILDFHGKPLVAWSLEIALKCEFIDEVVLSSEDEEILKIGFQYGENIPLKRPENLSRDESSTTDVILHTIEKLGLLDDDVILIMQPTSPLRSYEDLLHVRDVFKSNGAEGVVSVCECDHPPQWSSTLRSDHQMIDFISKEYLIRSQELAMHYRINGAFYMFKVGAIKRRLGVFYDKGVFAAIMPRERSIDIDTELDFVIAQSAFSYLEGKFNSVK